jgi:hypothetical protein
MRTFHILAARGGVVLRLAGAETATFADAAPGALPPGWTARILGQGRPQWTVEPDDFAPSRPLVLKQSGWTPKPSFPLCLKDGSSLGDGFVEVKFKRWSGTNDHAAGPSLA